MTALHRPSARRPLDRGAAAVLVLGLLLSACGSGGSSGSHSGSSISSSSREAAETNLRKIGTDMDDLIQAYKAGNTAEAQRLAEDATTLYEGPTEQVVAAVDPADNRQLDPLVMATLAQQVKSGAPAADIENSANRSKTLANQALQKLLASE